MSRIPGEPLDSIWNTLGESHKASVREQLDAIVDNFRSIPAPPTHECQGVFGGGNPRRCKDARRRVRVAEGPINNEDEFNQFLASNSLRAESGNIAMLRTYLEANHKLVMTHGDLHPRNIMVEVTPQPLHQDGNDALSQRPLNTVGNTDSLPTAHVTIKAVLDWEMCGWYPDYWEYVKALNTISPGDGFDDWWAYLPPRIGQMAWVNRDRWVFTLEYTLRTSPAGNRDTAILLHGRGSDGPEFYRRDLLFHDFQEPKLSLLSAQLALGIPDIPWPMGYPNPRRDRSGKACKATQILQRILTHVEWKEFTGAEGDGHWIKEPEGFDQILQFVGKQCNKVP
ncbi:hypothetical protein N8T08_008820 [Aspergillus melleus]|uniref:Uncharacterized protein n=1 Tax=Aspergillus melleus TaxID=138277 RepID=A0ACC3AW06_9EURO|nr:hypothetical protein N8T08_008820 [Aspergillus melleus]